MKLGIAALFIIIIATPVSHATTIYTWIDADGVKSFSDTPPPSRQNAQIITIAPVSNAFRERGISGLARVVDGDTLDVVDTKIRLYGIDAIEKRQSCLNVFKQPWPCGQAATTALKDRIGASLVRCEPRDKDRYGRTVAVCYAGALNLNEWMVSQGWAVAYTRYARDYIGQENEARGLKKNIWSGSFVPPASYRHGDAVSSAATVLPAYHGR